MDEFRVPSFGEEQYEVLNTERVPQIFDLEPSEPGEIERLAQFLLEYRGDYGTVLFIRCVSKKWTTPVFGGKLCEVLSRSRVDFHFCLIGTPWSLRMCLRVRTFLTSRVRLWFADTLGEAQAAWFRGDPGGEVGGGSLYQMSHQNALRHFYERWREKKETLRVECNRFKIVRLKPRTFADYPEFTIDQVFWVEGRCLFVSLSGHLGEGALVAMYQSLEQMQALAGVPAELFSVIIDLRAVKSISSKARLAARRFHQEREGMKGRQVVVAGPVTGLIIRTGRLLYPDYFDNLSAYRDFTGAFAQVFPELRWKESGLKSGLSRWLFGGRRGLGRRVGVNKKWENQQTSAELDRLYEFVGKMGWSNNLADLGGIETADPRFRVVYDSLQATHRDFLSILEELREVSTERLELESQLRHADKVLAIGTLASGIAHDFNNILWVIQGNAERLRRRLEGDSPYLYFVDEILAGCGRGKSLIDQIMTFSRKRSLENIPVQIAEVTRETLRFMAVALPTSVKLNCFSHPGVEQLCILGEQEQLQQVITNLITNAYQSLKEKGEISVTVEPFEILVSEGTEWAGVGPGAYVLLKVSDTGCGISPEKLPRIFDPFFTTKEVGEGTGLGLSTVHGIVSAMGGRVLVESEEGKGTEFSVYLPTIDGVPGVCREADIVSIPNVEVDPFELTLHNHTRRVLVVDDDLAVLATLNGELTDLGLAVTACNDARAALAILRADPDGYELLITDQVMPSMGGDELVAEVSRLVPHLPTILLTGFSEVIGEHNFQEFGVAGYCRKPVSMEELGKLVERVFVEHESKGAFSASRASVGRG